MVVGDIEPWLVSFLFHVFEYRVEGLDDGGVGEVFDRDRVDIVGVVIVRHVVVLVAVGRLDWEGADWLPAGALNWDSWLQDGKER